MPSSIFDDCRVALGLNPGAFWFSLLVILAMMMPARRLQAQVADQDDAEERASAMAKLEAGARLLKDGNYAEALETFRSAYNAVPSPKIFFNIGLANVGLDRPSDAIEAFQRFIDEAKTATPTSIAQARAQIDQLWPKVARIDIACALPDVALSVDGRPIGKTPLPRPIAIDPGEHQLQARAPGSPSVLDPSPILRTLSVTAGDRRSVRIDFPDHAATSPPITPPAAPPPTVPPGLSAPPSVLVTKASDIVPSRTAPQPSRRTWIWIAAAAIGVAAGVAIAIGASGGGGPPVPTLGQHMVTP